MPDDWLVTRRADLEVEIRGLDDARRLARAVHRGRPYSRPVTRLSAALAGAGRRWEGGDDHRVVLLEGGPGAGKSTALRDRVRDSLEEAVRRPGAELVIPVYVDLRDFRPGGPVTAAAIRAHIMACMSGGGDGRLASFVRTWFDHGLDAGWWWFLFDSFDELPALLTARNPARTAEDYASAITAFLYDLTPCRAVIATRDAADCATFRSLPQLRILPMSTQVQRQLIEHIAVSRGRRLRISGWLATAPAPIQEMAENPLLLSLLCHTITRHAETWVPGDRYEVLDGFVRDRLSPDERRAEWVGDFAAEIAMAMTRDAGPGLNPSVAELRAALAPPGGGGPPPEAAVLQVLDELKEAKLGRYTTTATRPAQRRFAFAHRSVQEYFVTRALLAQPDRVPPRELLSEPRWQGAAVSLLRTGPAANVAALVAEARRILDSDPSDPSDPSGPGEEDRMGADRPVLAVLAGGFAPPEPAELPADIRDRVGRSLLRMWAKGSGSERIEAVRFVPAADPGTAVKVLKLAFGHSSAFYRDEAYRRTVSMPRIPDTLLHEVRRSLVTLWVDGRLWRDAAIVEAQMRGGSLLGAVRLLRFGWLADLALCLAVMPVWFLLTDEEQDVQMLVIGGGLFGLFWHLGYHHVLRQAAWPGAEGPWHRRVWRFLRHTALFPGQVSDFASSFRRMLCGVSALGAILLLPIDYFTGAPAGTVLGLLALSVIALLVCVWPSGVREAVLHGRTGADLGEWLLLPLRPFPQRFRRAGRRLRSPARWWPDWLRPRALSRYYSGRYKWWKIAGTVAAVLAGGGYSVFEDPIDALLRENPLLRRLVATAAFVILAPLYLYGVVRITRPLLRARRDRKAVDAFRADAQRADPEVLGLPAFLEILAALRTTDGLHRLVSGLSAEPQEELADATLLPVGAEVMELLSWIAAARERFDALESASPGEDAPLTLDGWREEWEALLTDDGDLEVLALADRESLDLIAALQLTWSARTA
ncbi:NACHT domain-containing protein [Nonomuraea wenchangensis]|uniref:NACHT domain-containing protein n=1 Tax=Nonomuraea wenchangensis TaxID=568860 RepID=A0A1I0BZ80_9ACTN|nr:hypothetical protein [Nonomuraea wenchangensis]SET11735.1 hypothetical protein SAMN05421811_102100 [Nonomuraea wenchangensis]